MKRDPLPSISLYCTKDGADKEYHAAIKEHENGFIVELRYGKRGNAKLQKAPPVVMTFDQAVAHYESIIKEKTSPKKGYTQDLSGNAYTDSANAGKMSGNLPHLLTSISFERLIELANDDRYGFEIKVDGERQMVDKREGNLVPSNKLGVINSLSANITSSISSFDDILLDGESCQHKFYVFDILRLNGVCLKHYSAEQRCQIYQSLSFGPDIATVNLVTGTANKLAMIASSKDANGVALVEGIVVKLLSAPYKPGRAAATIATQFKYKFVDDVSCIVSSIHTQKRSVTLTLLDVNGNKREVGSVGVPVNAIMPEIGNVIDVQYRHLFLGGDLCEPVYLKPRSDIAPEECLLSQILRVKEKA